MMDEKKTNEVADKPSPIRQAMANAERDYMRPPVPLSQVGRTASSLTRVSEALERAEKFAEALERATADLERQLVNVKGRL